MDSAIKPEPFVRGKLNTRNEKMSHLYMTATANDLKAALREDLPVQKQQSLMSPTVPKGMKQSLLPLPPSNNMALRSSKRASVLAPSDGLLRNGRTGFNASQAALGLSERRGGVVLHKRVHKQNNPSKYLCPMLKK